MKKIILGTLVMLTIGMGFGFAQTQKKNDTETKTETKSSSYYKGYTQAANDYSKKNQEYNPNYCNKTYTYSNEATYDCIQGYQDSWKRNSEVAPRTPKDNSNNQ